MYKLKLRAQIVQIYVQKKCFVQIYVQKKFCPGLPMRNRLGLASLTGSLLSLKPVFGE